MRTDVEVKHLKLVKDMDLKKPITIPLTPYGDYDYNYDLFVPAGSVLLELHCMENGRATGYCWLSVKEEEKIISTPLHPDFDFYRFLEAQAVKDGAIITDGDETTPLFY